MKKKALAALILGISMALAACGNNSGDGATGTKFNKQDVTFAQEMIPHHQQAIEMAKLADKRTVSTEVKNLAAGIQAAQDPEIMKMEGWLKDWNKPMTNGGMPGMNHGSAGAMPGMMSDADMKSLQGAAETEFDMMFLTMMIKHHQGAITMAASEIANGKNDDTVALAKTIMSAQNGEIATMKDLLKK